MSFIDHFNKIEDTRSHINKKHELLDIIFLTVSAILSGAEGWKEIKAFGDAKLDWLRKFREFENGIPVDDTVARIISALAPNALLECLISWVNEMREHQGKELIAFDGKTLKGSFDGERIAALHSVSAYAVEQGLVLAHSKSKGKKNEIETVMELIELLELKDSIVTTDAMSCQKKITKAITSKGGDYILQVKDNQKKLHEQIKAYFHKVYRDEPNLARSHYFEEVDAGHGRVEKRQYCQLEVTDWFDHIDGWAGLNTIIEVKRERHLKGKITNETSYFVSSLEVNPQEAGRAIRGHWGIENSSHWVLDVTFKEDDSRIRRGDAPENMATFRRFAMNMAKLSPIKDSMKGKLKSAAWNDDIRAKLIFG